MLCGEFTCEAVQCAYPPDLFRLHSRREATVARHKPVQTTAESKASWADTPNPGHVARDARVVPARGVARVKSGGLPEGSGAALKALSSPRPATHAVEVRSKRRCIVQ